jgi:ornithine cyclodeaminase
LIIVVIGLHMTKLITCEHVKEIVKVITLEKFLAGLIDRLEQDFCDWNKFEKVARPAFHSTNGVLELMPVSDNKYFACKTVNGHPVNSTLGKLCVVATGQLNTVEDGYPVLVSEMTLLTALRTSATAVLASKLLANRANSITIIGCGAQSEFLISAHITQLEVDFVYYYDIDLDAMVKFYSNIKQLGIDNKVVLIPLSNPEDSIFESDIIITCIAEKSQIQLFEARLVSPGTHINAIGGDCPGKTELDPDILKIAKIVVEYTPQTLVEGELQNFQGDIHDLDVTELWEVVSGIKQVRKSNQDITLFDAVGFALEDFTILNYINELSEELGIFQTIQITPQNLSDPKDLFGFMNT